MALIYLLKKQPSEIVGVMAAEVSFHGFDIERHFSFFNAFWEIGAERKRGIQGQPFHRDA